MKRLLILCLVISTIFISVFLLFSCGSGSGSGGLIPFITSGSSSSSQGKISNNFSTSLNFDADNDGDIDSGYLMDGLINGGNQDDIIFSLASDNNLIYFTGESFNQSNLTSNMIVGKIDLEGNFLSFFNPGSNIPFEIQSQNGNMSSTGIDIQTNGQFVFSLGIATNQAGNKSFIMLSIFDKEATNISSSNVFITGASTENSLPADMSVIDNSIYVTGRSGGSAFINKYIFSGTGIHFDTSFSGDGIWKWYYTPPGSGFGSSPIPTFSNSIFVNSGYAYITGGVPISFATNIYTPFVAKVKINNSANFDPLFNGGSPVILNNIIGEGIGKYVEEKQNKIYVIGEAKPSVNDNYDIFICRLNSNGNKDNSFGTGGKIFINIASNNTVGSIDNVSSAFIDGSGAIFIAGTTYLGNNGGDPGDGPGNNILSNTNPIAGPGTPFIVKVLNSGTLDTSFAQNGILLIKNPFNIPNSYSLSTKLFPLNGALFLSGSGDAGTQNFKGGFILKIE